MQFELKTLVWDRKELQDHLKAAVREHTIMESMLIELEEDLDKAVARIELLKGEVNILKYLEVKKYQFQQVHLHTCTLNIELCISEEILHIYAENIVPTSCRI